jgi:hypothetical protein
MNAFLLAAFLVTESSLATAGAEWPVADAGPSVKSNAPATPSATPHSPVVPPTAGAAQEGPAGFGSRPAPALPQAACFLFA